MNQYSHFSFEPRHQAQSFNRYLAALLVALLCAMGGTQTLAQGDKAAPVAATVNINRADATTLEASLNGVGASRAEAIVRYREEFGPFTTIDQLAEVKGIGAATVDRNRAVITLD